MCSSGVADRGLEGIEIGWVEGHEPEMLNWLRGRGMLSSGSASEGSIGHGAGNEKESKSEPTAKASKEEKAQKDGINLSSLESDILARMAKYSANSSKSATATTQASSTTPSFSSCNF